MARRLQSANTLLGPAVAETLQHLDLADEDVAAARLARHYATVLDDTEDPELLAKLGPKLLDALEALGATPRARAARKGGGSAPGQGKLAALRSARPA